MLGKSFDALFKQKFVGGFSPVKRTSVLYFDLKEFFVCFFEVFFFLTSARGMALVTAMLACPFVIYLVHWFGSE